MKCPSCPSENLLMTVRAGSQPNQGPPPVPVAQTHQHSHRVRRDDDSVDEDYDDRYRKKKCKSWLGDILDFD